MIAQYWTALNTGHRRKIKKSWSNQEGVLEEKEVIMKGNVFAEQYNLEICTQTDIFENR